jgi:ComF family protein
MVARSLSRLGGVALDLVYPPRCTLCGKHGSFLCEACESALPRTTGRRCDACWLPLRDEVCEACAEHPTSLKRLRSVYRYEEGVRALVHAFKFRGQSSLDKTLGAQLARCYEEQRLEADLIVPVPLTKARRRGRGYNQAALLAREVSRATAVAMVEALRRVGKAKAQAGSASAEERRQNVIGAFEVADARAIAGRRVLVVDDVATTGATLGVCSDALLAAGASDVFGLTLARED